MSLLDTLFIGSKGDGQPRLPFEKILRRHDLLRDVETRAQDFCNYTIMEVRKGIQKTGDPSSLSSFDHATTRFQSQFRFQDKRGRERIHSSFDGSSVQQRAEDLGTPWDADYNNHYHLASMHTHGAPGAVLHQLFVHRSASPQNKERDSTALIGYLSMKVLVADIHLLVRNDFAADSTRVDEAINGALEFDPPE